MLPFPLENNLFLRSSETLDGVVLVRHPLLLSSPPQKRAGHRCLGIHLIPAWPFLILGSQSSELWSRCSRSLDGSDSLVRVHTFQALRVDRRGCVVIGITTLYRLVSV